MNQPLPELQQAKVLPMVGDDVLFHINGARIYSPCPEQLNADQPMAAKVVFVWGPEMVNLQVIDHQGNPRAVTSVRFMQPDDEDTPCGAYCTLPVIECEPGLVVTSEQAIVQAGADKAPRVTPFDIEAEIRSEFYFTAEHGVLGASEMGTRPAAWTNMDQVTICVLILRNGVKVVGVNEGPVSRENFSELMGRKFAREKAIDQIWPMLGYQLRSKLAAA
jgi:hypothetical protein